MKIILIGPQGSGKGTQAKMISEKLGIPHISSGDMLRALPRDTPFGKRVHGLIDNGILVPDGDMTKIVEERLAGPDCKKGFILDGFPRNINQAKMLKAAVDRVVYLDISDAEAIHRLSGRRQCRKCGEIYGVDVKPKRSGACDKCGGELYQRDDDKPDAILKRLNTFHRETEPLAKFYERLGLFRKVDASGDVEDVFTNVLKALGEK